MPRTSTRRARRVGALLSLLVATAAILPHFAQAQAGSPVTLDTDPGTGSPPATLGGHAMTTYVDGVENPGGGLAVGFSAAQGANAMLFGPEGLGGDGTYWLAGNSYAGSTYNQQGEVYGLSGLNGAGVAMSLPPGTVAFYL